MSPCLMVWKFMCLPCGLCDGAGRRHCHLRSPRSWQLERQDASRSGLTLGKFVDGNVFCGQGLWVGPYADQAKGSCPAWDQGNCPTLKPERRALSGTVRK